MTGSVRPDFCEGEDLLTRAGGPLLVADELTHRGRRGEPLVPSQ